MPPNSLSICPAAVATALLSVTSSIILRISGIACPAPVAAAMMLDSVSSRDDLAAMAIFEAPARAKDTAVALPIPLEAPVMKMLRPFCVGEAIKGYESS